MSLNIYGEYKPLPCHVCGKDVFSEKTGNVLIILDREDRKILEVLPVCKGECDRETAKSRSTRETSDGWRDVSDFKNPVIFAKRNMEIMNNLFMGNFTEESWEQYKQIIATAYQYILREPSEDEWSQNEIENMLPFG